MLDLTKNMVLSPVFLAIFSVILSIALQGIIFKEKDFAHALVVLRDFNFAAVGDWGCGINAKNTLNNILDKKPELVLALGDYSYTTLANCWLNIVDPIDEKLKIAIGNHEDTIYARTYGNDSYKSYYLLNQYMRHFGLTKQYYSFNYQNVHFTVMSTEIPFDVASAQYEFVKNDLSQAAADPNIEWIIVYFHNPMYSSPNRVIPNNISRDMYHPLFDEYGVDLILQGHNHNYQRSYPLKYNPSNSSNPVITTAEKNKYNDPTGVIFLIVGTGGQSLYQLDGRYPFTVVQDTLTYGFLNIGIVNEGLTMNATFYGNDGTIKDKFTIDKSPHKANSISITNATAGTATINETIELNLLPIHRSSYHYEPSLILTGSNYTDIESNSTLELTQFSVATWFRTTMDVPFGFNAYIVNKGGIGSDSKGSNMNYGIWMTSSETIRAGFEDSSGVPYDIESQGSRNLYVLYGWHYVVATYDGSILRLYIDGVQIASKSTSGAAPDNTGIQPVRIGANSLAPNDFFIGQVDEVRIWNRTLTDSEIADAYNNGVFNTNEQVLYLPSGNATSASSSRILND
jgi:hypothetical protein